MDASCEQRTTGRERGPWGKRTRRSQRRYRAGKCRLSTVMSLGFVVYVLQCLQSWEIPLWPTQFNSR